MSDQCSTNEQCRLRSNRSGGNRITDWTALAAFVISILGIFWTVIADRLTPAIDVAFPETIQIECSNYDFDEQVCPDDANFEILVDLFSIWNKSSFSTQVEILEKITAVAKYNGQEEEKVPLSWKYFTDITDVSADKKNTGRTPIPKGQLENLETEFVVDRKALNESDVPAVKWKRFVDGVVDQSIKFVVFEFEIYFAHSKKRRMICEYTIDQRMVDGLRSEGMYFHNFPRDVLCRFA